MQSWMVAQVQYIPSLTLGMCPSIHTLQGIRGIRLHRLIAQIRVPIDTNAPEQLIAAGHHVWAMIYIINEMEISRRIQ